MGIKNHRPSAPAAYPPANAIKQIPVADQAILRLILSSDIGEVIIAQVYHKQKTVPSGTVLRQIFIYLRTR